MIFLTNVYIFIPVFFIYFIMGSIRYLEDVPIPILKKVGLVRDNGTLIMGKARAKIWRITKDDVPFALCYYEAGKHRLTEKGKKLLFSDHLDYLSHIAKAIQSLPDKDRRYVEERILLWLMKSYHIDIDPYIGESVTLSERARQALAKALMDKKIPMAASVCAAYEYDAENHSIVPKGEAADPIELDIHVHYYPALSLIRSILKSDEVENQDAIKRE